MDLHDLFTRAAHLRREAYEALADLNDPTTQSYWPDGTPIHDQPIFVRLSCGHERVSVGWRGEEGACYYCVGCRVMATMEVVQLADDEPPSTWSMVDA